VDGTIVTDADGVAQKLIVDAIRSHHPLNLKIVCEESEEEENRYSSTRSLSVEEALSVTLASSTTTGNVTSNSWKWWYQYASQQIQNCQDLVPPASTSTLHDDCTGQSYCVDSNRISIFG
jgi:3'-phosphoadenosine 5'-phosphosulfate (PAPS) 3'-phosphatase